MADLNIQSEEDETQTQTPEPIEPLSITEEAVAPSRIEIPQSDEQGFFSKAFDAFRGWRETRPQRKFTRDEAREVTKENIALNRKRFATKNYGQFGFGTSRAPAHSALVRAGLEAPPEGEVENTLNQYLRGDPDQPVKPVQRPLDVSRETPGTDPNRKEDPWGLVIWDAVTNVPALWKRQYGGAKMFLNAPRDLAYILEAAADEGVAPENSFALEVEAYVQGKDPGDYYRELLTDTAENEGVQEGQRIFQEATEYLENYRPNVREDSVKYYAGAIVEGSLHMAPALIATAASRSPSVGAALMGGQVFADQYADSVTAGRSHSEAVVDSTVFAAAETLTERVPLGILTREGGSLLARILKAGGAEAIQEPLTQLIQEGYRMGVIDEEMTLGEALMEITMTEEGRAMLRRSAIIGFGVGATLATVSHPFYRTVDQQDLKPPTTGKPKRQTRMPSEEAVEITDAEAQQLGLEKVEVSQDVLERAAAGDPLTIDEQYTLTNEGYGRFVGQEERVMLLPKGRRSLMEFRDQVEQADAEAAVRVAEFEEAAAVPTREFVDDETTLSRSEAVGYFEDFVADPETVEIPTQAFEALGRDRAIWDRLSPTERVEAATTLLDSERREGPRLVAEEQDVSERETFRSDKPESRRLIQERMAAAEARVDPEPTEGQKKAGNYKKGHVRVDGMDVAIENPKGGVRSGTDQKGKPWSIKMKDAYGYIKGTESRERDGYGGFDQVDAFIGRYPESGHAVVINQKRDPTKPISPENFDEHKVMIGYRTTEEALKAYRRNYSDRGRHLGDHVEMTTAELKQWLDTGKTKEMVTADMVGEKTAPRRPERTKTNAGKGRTREQVQRVLRPIYRVFRTVPPVRVVEAVEDLPSHLQVALDSPEAKRNTTGIYDQGGLVDNVYIIANNVRDEQEAIETMLHEVVGHFGLRNVMDDYQFNEIMDDVAKSFGKEVRDIANTYELDFTDTDERRVAAEEFIAHTAQKVLVGRSVTDRAKALLKQVVEAIKNLLRRFTGKPTQLTTGQIHSIIAQASDYVARPGGYQRDKQRGARRHIVNPTYYSQMFKVVNDDQAKARSPEDWKNWLNVQVKKGRVKAEELRWSGLNEFLDELTWKDVSRLSGAGLPRELQEAKNTLDELVGRTRTLLTTNPAYPTPSELNKANNKINEFYKGKPKKLAKEVLLKQIQLEGTHIEVVEPLVDDVNAPQFDENYPDQLVENKDEYELNEAYEAYKKASGIEGYMSEAFVEIYQEHSYNPSLTEEENKAAGWDGVPEDEMHDEAIDLADQKFDEEEFFDYKRTWLEKNTQKVWFLDEGYRIEIDSDGDYVVTLEDEDIGVFYSPDDANDAIANHFSEGITGTRWGEYTLPGGKKYQELLFRWTNADPGTYEIEGHWGSNENMVAHARFDEREDIDGNPLIFVDEIQSDWHQEIRDRGTYDAEEADRLAQEQNALWKKYANELAPKMLAEMRRWPINNEIAGSFSVANNASQGDGVVLLTEYVTRSEAFERQVDEEINNLVSFTQDPLRPTLRKVINRYHFDPYLSESENRERGWDGTSVSVMQQEAKEIILSDESQMKLIRERVSKRGFKSITWNGFLDKLQTITARGNRLTIEIAKPSMDIATLYTAMAPVIGENLVAHIPIADIPSVNKELIDQGQRVLLSYFESQRRRSVAVSGIAPAPFEKTWQLLVIKHLIRESVDRGYSKLAIAPGEVHGFRWSGATEVNEIEWSLGEQAGNNTPVYIRGLSEIGGVKREHEHSTTILKLQSVVGADVAAIIKGSKKQSGSIKAKEVGRNFIALPKSGSETLSGSREIYNVITPSIVNKFLKKYKTRMQMGAVASLEEDLEKYGLKTVNLALEHSAYKDHVVVEIPREVKSNQVPHKDIDKTWYAVFDPSTGTYWQRSLSEEDPIRVLEELRRTEMGQLQGFETWMIDITPELAAAARNSFPLFHRRKNRTGDSGLDDALEWADQNIGPKGPRTVERIQERVNEILRIENKQAKIEQAMIDQFAGLKWAIRQTHGHDLPAEISGYKQAHFTTSMDSQMFVFLTHGVPYWERVGGGTITQIKPDSKGLLEVLEPVADNIREWGYWMAARRANRLLQEGREALFTQKRINELLKLGKRFPEFQEVADAYNDWKTQFLDWASGAGVINEDTRPLWDQADYVPFYRIKADELGGSFALRSGMGGPGIANVAQPIKRLLGSKHPLGDILENIIVNFQHIADTAMKNKSAQLAVENLQDTGLITPAKGKDFMKKEFVPLDEIKRKLKAVGVNWQAMSNKSLEAMQHMWTLQRPHGDQFISVLYNGKKKWFEVHEETLLRSMTAINERKFSSIMGRLGMWVPRKAKRIGTTMITLAPGFMAANWFRDVFMAFTNSRHAKLPKPWAGVTGAWKAFTKSPEMVSMMAAGGAFYSGYINANDPVATTKAIKRSLRQTGYKQRILDAPWKLFHFYNDIAAASENANRIGSAYIPAIKAGAGKAEAVWEAKDLMNFSKHGDHALMQFFAQSVMFLNARIQGLVRYGQRFSEAPGITFAKSMMYAMAVLALWLKNKDEEWYKRLPEEEKDLYIHFRVNDKHWRLPKAFEVGMVFGVGVERMFEYFYSNEDDAGKLAIDRLWFVTGQVFNFFNPQTIVPLPQFIAPLYEATNNWNAFFQAPIVPEYMMDVAQVKPEIVYRPRTSPTMRALAEGVPNFAPNTMRNPILLEHLVRGYFGTLGAYVMMMSDDLVRAQMDMPPRPKLRWQQVPFVGRFYRGDEPPSRTNYEEILYQVINNAKQIERAINQMERLEMHDEVDQFLEAGSKYDSSFTNQEIRDAAKAMEGNYKQIQRLRRETTELWEDEDMDPEQKLRELNRIYQDKLENAREAWMERPGAAIQFEALEQTLIDMPSGDRPDYLSDQNLPFTRDLLISLKHPNERLQNIYWENSA